MRVRWRFLVAAALLAIGLSSTSKAGIVVYNFDDPAGTINNAALADGTSTTFSYTQPIPGPVNDTGNPNLTANFLSVFSFPVFTTTSAADGANTNSNITGRYLKAPANGSGGNKLSIVFSDALNFASIDYFVVGTDPGPINYSNSLTFSLFLNGGAVGTPVTVTAGTGTPLSGTFSTVNPTAFFFNQVEIQSTSSSGRVLLDNLSVNPIPELDASTATSAMALLGTAILMVRGRRRPHGSS